MWFTLSGLHSGVSPFFEDLMYQQLVALFNDRSLMPLNEILRFHTVVFDAPVCKEIYRNCFLTQGIHRNKKYCGECRGRCRKFM